MSIMKSGNTMRIHVDHRPYSRIVISGCLMFSCRDNFLSQSQNFPLYVKGDKIQNATQYPFGSTVVNKNTSPQLRKKVLPNITGPDTKEFAPNGSWTFADAYIVNVLIPKHVTPSANMTFAATNDRNEYQTTIKEIFKQLLCKR